jgi:hypothetical protein
VPGTYVKELPREPPKQEEEVPMPSIPVPPTTQEPAPIPTEVPIPTESITTPADTPPALSGENSKEEIKVEQPIVPMGSEEYQIVRTPSAFDSSPSLTFF